MLLQSLTVSANVSLMNDATYHQSLYDIHARAVAALNDAAAEVVRTASPEASKAYDDAIEAEREARYFLRSFEEEMRASR